MGWCGKITFLLFTGIAVFVGIKINALFEVPPVPKLENTWWGPGKQPAKVDTSIRPFKIAISDKVIDDLKTRLKNARELTPALEGANQHYGMHSNLLKEILQFWQTKYDWREREKYFNKYPQFKTNIQGLDIHFIHVKPANPSKLKVLPLLMLHGWPGSVKEFYEIIPLLSKERKDQDFVFELIIPSLPGYGFSDGAVRPGLGAVQMAQIFKNFMERLNHKKFYVQGGDWGAIITNHLSALYPETILGGHSNMCSFQSTLGNIKWILGSFYPSMVVDKKHQDKLYPISSFFANLMLEFGYMHLQATKPDTIGVALNNSPVGLAAYILEKFTTWTNPELKNQEYGGLKEKFSYVDLLDNVMVYWVTNSITTSMRLYAESMTKEQISLRIQDLPVTVPYACARFAHEILHAPDCLLKSIYKNLIQTTDYDDGGHFAAFEVPKLLAEDIWSAISKMEKYYTKTTILEDLQHRLDTSRPLTPPLDDIQQQYGMNTNLLAKILDYWKSKYTWKHREVFLNQFPQFKTNIQGLDIHFAHVKPKNLMVLPMLLLHGWPSTFRDYFEMIPMMTTPRKGQEFVFEVIVPSLPGFGFSNGATKPGLGFLEMGVIFKNLMNRLGFGEFYVTGGDWGAIIATAMATVYPREILGVHSNGAVLDSPKAMGLTALGAVFPGLIIEKEYEDRLYPLSRLLEFSMLETGYLHLHATKPDTIGVALNDSPIGLAAYILEKYITWTNPEWKNLPDGGLTKKFTSDQLLDNVMLYWVTNSMTTSVRLYAECFNSEFTTKNMASIPTDVPTAWAWFKHEIYYVPETVLKTKFKNVVQVTHFDDGGHFPAFEQPKLLADDVWTFVGKIRSVQQ